MRNIILGQEEVYTANPNVWSFKRVKDIVNGINLRLSNMAGGFPFEFNMNCLALKADMRQRGSSSLATARR